MTVVLGVILLTSGCGASHGNAAARVAPSTISTQARPQPAKPCGDYEYRPQSSDLAKNIAATNTDCSVARNVVAAAPGRPNAFADYTAEGFQCRAGPEAPQPPGGGMTYRPYTCANDSGATVTFDRY